MKGTSMEVAGVETIQPLFPPVAVACLSVPNCSQGKGISQYFCSFPFPLGDVELATIQVTPPAANKSGAQVSPRAASTRAIERFI